MTRTPVELVQALLKDRTNPEVVNALVAPDAIYMSLNYDNPDLQKLMPWAGTHEDGRAAILKTFVDVGRYWTVVDFDVRQIFGAGENVAVFGGFTLKSVRLGKQVTSPFSILATVKDGKVTYMQYMEDTFATSSTFRSGGSWTFQSNPDGGEVTV